MLGLAIRLALYSSPHRSQPQQRSDALKKTFLNMFFTDRRIRRLALRQWKRILPLNKPNLASRPSLLRWSFQQWTDLGRGHGLSLIFEKDIGSSLWRCDSEQLSYSGVYWSRFYDSSSSSHRPSLSVPLKAPKS